MLNPWTSKLGTATADLQLDPVHVEMFAGSQSPVHKVKCKTSEKNHIGNAQQFFKNRMRDYFALGLESLVLDLLFPVQGPRDRKAPIPSPLPIKRTRQGGNCFTNYHNDMMFGLGKVDSECFAAKKVPKPTEWKPASLQQWKHQQHAKMIE
jgi:hypothetical protein